MNTAYHTLWYGSMIDASERTDVDMPEPPSVRTVGASRDRVFTMGRARRGVPSWDLASGATVVRGSRASVHLTGIKGASGEPMSTDASPFGVFLYLASARKESKN